MGEQRRQYTGFAGHRLIASGELMEVALKAKEWRDQGERAPLLIFEDDTGALVDLDFQGSREALLTSLARKKARAEAPEKEPEETRRAGPGRPKLGVVSREISLLPRHWEWLNGQPGGASVTLRKLVEEALREGQGAARARRAQEAAYRVMYTLAGDFPGFEEASRAFFAKDAERFAQLIQPWPEDVRHHLQKRVASAFQHEREAAQRA